MLLQQGIGMRAARDMLQHPSCLAREWDEAVQDLGVQGIDLSKAGMEAEKAKLQVIFVLGGPGSGKGTQVALNPAS